MKKPSNRRPPGAVTVSQSKRDKDPRAWVKDAADRAEKQTRAKEKKRR